MKAWTIMSGAMLAALAAAPTLGQDAVSPATPTATGQDLPADQVDAEFRAFAREAHVPGLVWGIVKDGRLVHFGGDGVQRAGEDKPVDTRSLFRIASMSKAFTALAILKLRDEGKLSLDDVAEVHVPEMRGWTYPTGDAPRIRVRDLLTHSAGFVTDNPWGDRQQPMAEAEFSRILRHGVPFSRAPRTAYEYSNFGYALLGRIVTNVSGRPYDRYIVEELMRPLGMRSTGYHVEASPPAQRAMGHRWDDGRWVPEPDMAHGVFGAMGGVETNAEDYARWIGFLLSGWPARDGPETGPVRRSTLREMAQGSSFARTSTRPAALPGEAPCRYGVAYAMGLSAGTDCDLGLVLSHSGGYPGYGSFMLLLPEHKVGLFAFANRTYAAPVAPLWKAALALHQAGLLTGTPIAADPSLGRAYEGVAGAYAAGSLAPVREMLAMNFLMDRSERAWQAELASLKQQAGSCDTSAPLTPTGALSGKFRWRCERGSIAGEVLLAPTSPPAIQELGFEVVAAP